jgi:Protein of unknown function (DUF2281)
MNIVALQTKIEMLPDDLKQQVLDYVDFLLSREKKRTTKVEHLPDVATTPTTRKSRFAGRISKDTAQDLQEQLETMRGEWK